MKKLKTESKKIIVNFGCGKTKIPGVIGLDIVDIPGYVDIVHDLDKTPYPFKKNSVDEIHMYHVLEHLYDPIKKMEEIHRILKPGGIINLRVPHFSSMGAFTDITHIRPFGYSSFDCFEKNNYQHFYTKSCFEILDKKIKYFGLYPNSGFYIQYIHPNKCPLIVRPFILLINYLIALSPTVFERLWCYWVGGATEVVVTLKKNV
jgi:SAM-dependent methyltransferase